jgi:outer membrane protein OmpA-like peptidoglycan-associated protein
LAERLKTVQDQAAQGDTPDGPPADTPQPLPDWKPASTSTKAIEVPLIKGLMVDSTISSVNGDLEDIQSVTDVNATTVSIDSDVEHAPKTPGGHPANLNTPSEVTGKGTTILDVTDLSSSNRLYPYFATGQRSHHPGALDRGVSTETLSQLRSGKLAKLQIATDLGTMMSASMKGHVPPTITQVGATPMYECDLQRVESQDLAFPVLLNNNPVELPVLHARCVMDNKDETDFYILDQPSNPIFLYTRLSSFGDSTQITRITFGTAKQDSLEQSLADKKPVEIYGIYFDFNSAYIKPESEAVLKQISEVMHNHPTWKLSVSGHTDNIVGNDFNQKLSQARAEAVKTALVNEYKIAPDRLTTNGYGASRPIADNSKVEGRARNRRVELQRQ